MKPEAQIQNEIRLALAPHAIMLRVNSGQFWTGKRVWDEKRKQYILTQLRPATGAPKGTSDLIGCRRFDGKFIALEIKTPTGKPSDEQVRFIDAVKASKGIAGIARSAEDALNIIAPARWVIDEDGYYPYCSKCGYEPERTISGKDNRTPYCPQCGERLENAPR